MRTTQTQGDAAASPRPFTQLDTNTRGMTVKGLWLFDRQLDAALLERSLAQALELWPHLAGRATKAADGVVEAQSPAPRLQQAASADTVAQAAAGPRPLDRHCPAIEPRRGGPLLAARLTRLNDGSVLGVAAWHACVDGAAFYRFVSDWAALARGQQPAAPRLDAPALLADTSMTAPEALARGQEWGWHKLSAGLLWRLVANGLSGRNRRRAVAYVSADRLEELRSGLSEAGGQRIGRHAALTALVAHAQLRAQKMTAADRCSAVTVVDLRGRVEGVEPTYARNAVVTAGTASFPGDATQADIALAVERGTRRLAHDPALLAAYAQTANAAARLKLPLLPFDLAGKEARRPRAVYVNNFLRFPVYDADFGAGAPCRVLPNDLPDEVKLWPAPPAQGGVEIHLRGAAACVAELL